MPPLREELRELLACADPADDVARIAAVLPVILAMCPRPPYLDWAALHRRTHQADLLQCHCGGRRRIAALVTEPDRIIELLEVAGIKRPRLADDSRASDEARAAPPTRPRSSALLRRSLPGQLCLLPETAAALGRAI